QNHFAAYAGDVAIEGGATLSVRTGYTQFFEFSGVAHDSREWTTDSAISENGQPNFWPLFSKTHAVEQAFTGAFTGSSSGTPTFGTFEVAGTGSAARIADAVGTNDVFGGSGTAPQPAREFGQIVVRDGGTLILGAAAGTPTSYGFQATGAYAGAFGLTVTVHAPTLVQAGGTLGGTGRIEGSGVGVVVDGTGSSPANASSAPATVSVAAGGVLAPGHGVGDGSANANIGTLYVGGNVALAAGATVHFDIASIAGLGGVPSTSDTYNVNDRLAVMRPLDNPAVSANGTVTFATGATNIAVTLSGAANAVQIKNDLASLGYAPGAAMTLAHPVILMTAEHLFAMPGANAVSTASWDTTYGGYNGGTNRVQVDGLTFTIATRLNGSIYEVALVSVSADAAGVPEPSTYAAGGAALLAGLLLLRRRRRKDEGRRMKDEG
ncbi:MAG: PEP-CTERM sorting domain-containing protein, partial [Puniceicoccales bacterium]|nr:PEP-CTERM sorting domain-containing protein [Puniceicoccales bacterium]